MITDASENINFVGKNLNAGGLWDVTPTIENGLTVTDADGNVIGTADQWYLTKIAKAVNNDSQVLLDAVDNSYALWRNTNDSLRKRLGELRFRTNETDGDGIWARYTSGKFSGSGLTAATICTSLATIRPITLKALMALLLTAVQAMRAMRLAAVRTN